MACDYVGTPKLSGVPGIFGRPSLVSVPMLGEEIKSQLSQITGHNLYPRYLWVTSNVTKKSKKYFWYWYPVTQISSQTCLWHQESIPYLFFDRSALGIKIWAAPEQFQKASNYNSLGIFLSIPGSSGQSLKIFHVNPGLVRSMWINLFFNPGIVMS